jgi:hypothetical protein
MAEKSVFIAICVKYLRRHCHADGAVRTRLSVAPP